MHAGHAALILACTAQEAARLAAEEHALVLGPCAACAGCLLWCSMLR